MSIPSSAPPACVRAGRRAALVFGALGLPALLAAGRTASAQVSGAPRAGSPLPAPAADVLIRMDDRQVRAAGVELVRPEPEAGAAELSLPGTVAVPPRQLRVVAAPAAALLEAILVAADERVAAGQPVARLRSTELVEAQRLFLQAHTASELAAEKARRDEELFRERIIAERRLLVTRSEAVGAAAELDERRQALGLLGMEAGEIEDLRRTRRIRPALVVTSPVDGAAIQLQAVAGERVAQSAPLMTVADLSTLWVNVQVPVSRAAAVEANGFVSLPAQGAEGFVLRVGRTVDPATQSVVATAEINRGADAVRPGQSVTAVVRLAGNGQDQWRLPAQAVVRHRERSWVFVRSPEGFRARPVTILSEGAQFASVRGHLVPEDRVATRGILSLLAQLSAADGS